MINFGQISMPGTHGPILTTPPQVQVVRRKFFGVRGESEIYGENAGRYLSTHIWLHNRLRTKQAIVSLLETLDAAVGTHADLVITTPGIPRTFKHCTFEGFEMGELGPLPDESGSLDGVTQSWWCEGILRWYQLQVGIGSDA